MTSTSTSIVLPDIPLKSMWEDILNPDVSYQTLWTNYPSQMMNIFQIVLDIRTKLTPITTTNNDQQSITPTIALDIFAKIKTGTSVYDLCLLYPQIMIQYGGEVASIAKCDSDHSTIQLNRFKEVVAKLRNGHSLSSLVQDYTDILATGAYDLIHLDKWMKTGIFPS